MERGNRREGVRMPGKRVRRGEKGRKKGEEGREGVGRKVRTPPPSIPAYAPKAV